MRWHVFYCLSICPEVIQIVRLWEDMSQVLVRVNYCQTYYIQQTMKTEKTEFEGLLLAEQSMQSFYLFIPFMKDCLNSTSPDRHLSNPFLVFEKGLNL